MAKENTLVSAQNGGEIGRHFEVAQDRSLTVEENAAFEQSKAVFFDAFYSGKTEDQALSEVGANLDRLGVSEDLQSMFLKVLDVVIDYSSLQKQNETKPFMVLTGCESVGDIDGHDLLFANDVLCVVPGEGVYLAENQDENEFEQSVTLTLSDGVEEGSDEERDEVGTVSQRENSSLIEEVEANSLLDEGVGSRSEEVDFSNFTSNVLDFALVGEGHKEDDRSLVVEAEVEVENGGPVVTAATNTVIEDGSVQGVISAFGLEGSNLTFSTTSVIEGLTLNADGSYHFDASSYDSLEVGETQAILVFVTATDDQGATGEATLTISVTGTNDAPIATAEVDSVQGTGITTGVVSASDVDLADGASLTFSTTSTLSGLTLNADGSYRFDAASYASLGAGETDVILVPITVTDDQGVTAETTLTITVEGVNDVGNISGEKTGAVIEDGATAEQTASGTLNVVDLDAGDATFVVQTGYAAQYGTFNLTAEGVWTYELNSSDAAVQELGVGQTLTDSIVVTTEGGDAGTVVVTIDGANDDLVLSHPSISAGLVERDVYGELIDDYSRSEEGLFLLNEGYALGQIPVTDIDGDNLTYRLSDSSAVPDGFTLYPSGTWLFEVKPEGDEASPYNYLSEGETFDEVIEVLISDGQGSQVTYTITLTVTGTNNAPVVTASSGEVFDNDILEGKISAFDVDLPDGESLTFSATKTLEGFTLKEDGSYTFDASSYNELKAGETREFIISVTATDEQGATNAVNLSITVTGTNNAPVAAVDIDKALAEGGARSITFLNATDAEGDALTYALSDDASPGFSLSASFLSFDPSDPAYDSLGVGEAVTAQAIVTVDDGNGGTDTQTITVTVTGTNDAPVAGALSILSAVEDATITGTLSASDVDLADGASLVFSLDGDVDGFTLSADGSYEFDASSYDSLTEGQIEQVKVNYTITDDQGAADAGLLTITVTGTNDAPVAAVDVVSDVFAGGASIFGSVVAADIDSDDLTYSLLDGVPGPGGFPLTENLPGGFSLNEETGSWAFDPTDKSYSFLSDGESQTVFATVEVKDGDGATDTQIITFIVTADTTGVKTATLDEIAYEEVEGVLIENTLTLIFEEDIDVSTLDLTDLVLSDSQSWGEDAVLTAVYNEGAESTGYTDTFIVDRGMASELSVDTDITVSADEFLDQAGNANEAFIIASI